MNATDEKIMAIDRGYLFDNENELLKFQGVVTDKQLVTIFMNRFEEYIEVSREEAETNEFWKQPIPYTIIKRGSDVFMYRRLGSGGEGRLFDKLSIGVGGHMNKIHGIQSWSENLKRNMRREVSEELHISIHDDQDFTYDVVGLVNDDSNEVGRVHIGILSILELPEQSSVRVKETDKLEGHWIRIKDLKKTPLFENLESWSKFATDIL